MAVFKELSWLDVVDNIGFERTHIERFRYKELTSLFADGLATQT